MPPGRKGRKATVEMLTPKQVNFLNAAFALCRAELKCPHCHQTKTFYKNGTLTNHPSQPNFICKSCSKNINAPTMLDIIKKTPDIDLPLISPEDSEAATTGCNTQTDSQTQTPMELSSNPNQPVTSTTETTNTTDINELRELIKQLQDEVRQLRAENEALRAGRTLTTNRNTSLTSYSSQFPTLGSSLTSTKALLPWHDPARVEQVKRTMEAKREQRRLQRQTAAARILQAPSENQGFQFVYLPTKARIPNTTTSPTTNVTQRLVNTTRSA